MGKQILKLKLGKKIRRLALAARLQYVNWKSASDICPTPRSKELSKKQIFTQLIMTFSGFHEARNFTAEFSRARYQIPLEAVEFSEQIEALFI
jgi:hypothetical protein